MSIDEAETVLTTPDCFTREEWARQVLSMEIAERPFLGKTLEGEDLKTAKEISNLRQKAARTVLYAQNSLRAIWYYKETPTKGNQFGAKQKRIDLEAIDE